MKYLITGCSGFVGRYLIDHIARHEPDAKLIGVARAPAGEGFPPGFTFRELNLLDAEGTADLVREIRPDFVVHLASYSSVGYSWQQPIESFKNNTNIFLNVLEAVHKHAPGCRILSVGSSEEYGVVTQDETPLSEDRPLRPVSPYAVARVAQEHLSMVYAKGYKMDIVCTRSFNHVGAGQSDQFVISSIARKFVEFMAGQRPSIVAGDTGVVRDFLDVRDVVRAYHVLLKQGISGEAYNVCGGRGLSIKEIITMLMEITGTKPPVEIDKSLLRPVENRVVIGSCAKLHGLTGWRPEIELKDTLAAIVEYWQKVPSSAESGGMSLGR